MIYDLVLEIINIESYDDVEPRRIIMRKAIARLADRHGH